MPYLMPIFFNKNTSTAIPMFHSTFVPSNWTGICPWGICPCICPWSICPCGICGICGICGCGCCKASGGIDAYETGSDNNFNNFKHFGCSHLPDPNMLIKLDHFLQISGWKPKIFDWLVVFPHPSEKTIAQKKLDHDVSQFSGVKSPKIIWVVFTT